MVEERWKRGTCWRSFGGSQSLGGSLLEGQLVLNERGGAVNGGVNRFSITAHQSSIIENTQLGQWRDGMEWKY